MNSRRFNTIDKPYELFSKGVFKKHNTNTKTKVLKAYLEVKLPNLNNFISIYEYETVVFYSIENPLSMHRRRKYPVNLAQFNGQEFFSS